MILNLLFRLKSALVFWAGVFFMFAWIWAPHVKQVAGRNFFVTTDSMMLLGMTLLVSLLGAHFLPDSFVWNRTGASDFQKRVKATSLGIGFLGLVAFVLILYWVNRNILHSFLSSADEHSCYFLAECLRQGKLYVDIPPLADFFKVVHVGMRGGKWFSVYPPGWPFIWALGIQLHIVDWLNPIMTAAAVFFFYLSGVSLFGRLATALGLVLLCLNPFFMFTAASYFSHATCLLCISVFLYAFLRWREAYAVGKGELFWASLCAFAVGYGLMTRYLTMAAVVMPFLLFHYLPIFFDWIGWGNGTSHVKILRFLPFTLKRPQLRKSDWLVMGIIAAFMLLVLYQNYLITGKPFRAPNKHDKSWERLGFRKDYTPIDGFFYLIGRVFYLMDWFAPACVGAYLLLIAQFSSRRTAMAECGNQGFPVKNESKSQPEKSGNEKSMLRALFRLTMCFIAAAYFFYYSWGGNQWGPRYLWEGMPFLCIAVADWMVGLWRGGASIKRRKFLLVFYIAALMSSGVLFAKQAEFTEQASRQRRSLYDLAENTIQGPAIVFIHGFLGSRLVMAEEDAVRNSPFLDGRILYAHDLGDRNKELMDANTGRKFYRGSYDDMLKQPKLESLK